MADIRTRIRVARSVTRDEDEFKGLLESLGVKVEDSSAKARRGCDEGHPGSGPASRSMDYSLSSLWIFSPKTMLVTSFEGLVRSTSARDTAGSP